jgi:hypothetical protein
MIGSYLLEALADFVLRATVTKSKVSVYVQKMKDGEAERTETFKVDKNHKVPVIVDDTDGTPDKTFTERLDPLLPTIEAIKTEFEKCKETMDLDGAAKLVRPIVRLGINNVKKLLTDAAWEGLLDGYVFIKGKRGSQGVRYTFGKL